MSTTNIYVLRLAGGRYYVGKADSIEQRYAQHLSGRGSAWTKLHKPIGIDKTFERVSPFEEDKITKEYMSKYGIDNVRGGLYVEIELPDSLRETLQREIWAAKDVCTRCGRQGHFVKDCYARTNVLGEDIEKEENTVWMCDVCEREFDSESECDAHVERCKPKTCYRCGRTGHFSTNCYASKHLKGYWLD
jgi:predicted GIY-YIG superfamily endonuclease